MPHWNMEYQVLYEDYRKNLEVKSEKKYMVCRVSKNDTRQRSIFAECQDGWHSANIFVNFFKKPLFAECQIGDTRQTIFFKKKLFAEC